MSSRRRRISDDPAPPESQDAGGIVVFWAMIGFGSGLVGVPVTLSVGAADSPIILPLALVAAVTLVAATGIAGRHGALGALAGMAASALTFVGCWAQMFGI